MIDWKEQAVAVVEVERRLMHIHHWTPQQIARLTMPEIEMALADDLEKPFGGVQLDSPEELVEYAAWWKSLGWQQRIEMARDG